MKRKGFTLAEGATHITMLDNVRKCAFTLAEVLITLGIIGVVAAMTLPALMGKYRENVTMTKLKKFYSTMAQAQLRSIADNGEVDGWDWVAAGGESNNELLLNWFNKYWGQYLNNIRIIDRKVIKDNELIDGGITFILGDGSVGNIAGFSGGYMHISYFPNYKTFINETAKDGVDAFLFGFAAQAGNKDKCLMRFDAYACDVNDENNLKNNTWGGCYPEHTANGHPYCTRLLQLNDWKTPKDYPYKF